MAASVTIEEYNGAAPGTPTDKTSGTVRLKNADDATVDLNNPMVVPTSGQDYSYEKWLRLRENGGSFSQISNVRWYTDGSNGLGTGVNLWAATTGTYRAPDVPDEGNDPPQFSDESVSPTLQNMVDAFGLTSGSPGDLDFFVAGPLTSGSPTEAFGDFLILVLEVDSTASNGVTSSETITFAWDEI